MKFRSILYLFFCFQQILVAQIEFSGNVKTYLFRDQIFLIELLVDEDVFVGFREIPDQDQSEIIKFDRHIGEITIIDTISDCLTTGKAALTDNHKFLFIGASCFGETSYRCHIYDLNSSTLHSTIDLSGEYLDYDVYPDGQIVFTMEDEIRLYDFNNLKNAIFEEFEEHHFPSVRFDSKGEKVFIYDGNSSSDGHSIISFEINQGLLDPNTRKALNGIEGNAIVGVDAFKIKDEHAFLSYDSGFFGRLRNDSLVVELSRRESFITHDQEHIYAFQSDPWALKTYSIDDYTLISTKIFTPNFVKLDNDLRERSEIKFYNTSNVLWQAEGGGQGLYYAIHFFEDDCDQAFDANIYFDSLLNIFGKRFCIPFDSIIDTLSAPQGLGLFDSNKTYIDKVFMGPQPIQVYLTDREGCFSTISPGLEKSKTETDIPEIIELNKDYLQSSDDWSDVQNTIVKCKNEAICLGVKDRREDYLYVWSTGDTASYIITKDTGWISAHAINFSQCRSLESDSVYIISNGIEPQNPSLFINPIRSNLCGSTMNLFINDSINVIKAINGMPDGRFQEIPTSRYIGSKASFYNTSINQVLFGLDDNGCWAEPLELSLFNQTHNDLLNVELHLSYGTIFCETNFDADYFEWYFEDMLIPYENKSSMVPDAPGEYEVVVFDSFGCGETQKIIIY